MTPFLFPIALFLFQDADTSAPATAGGSAILEMLRNSGPIALIVLGVLLICSIWSWAVILGKWGSFRRAASQSRRFLRAFRKATRLQEIATVSEQFKPSPLVNVFDEVYETYRRQTGGYGPPRNITALERAAQTASSESLTAMEKRLTSLATIGSTATFIGLFGTVMGIVDAFHGLGTAGAATLRAVAPGVSEA
ncbi:MAG: MotA/TolQ/ExbB proton channel family protein, partial [Silvibacterium sp.]